MSFGHSSSGSPQSHSERFAVFDLDRTITKQGTFTTFLLSTRRTFAPRAGLMLCILVHMARYKLGLIDRLDLKNCMLEAAFRGMDREAVERVAEDFVVRTVKTGIRTGFPQVLARHRDAGDKLVLATASVDLYAALFADHFRFDILVCTTTAFAGHGTQLPRILGRNCYGAEKKERVARALLSDDAVSREDVFVTAYSDHLSDLPLLKWADAGLVVRPRSKAPTAKTVAGLQIKYW